VDCAGREAEVVAQANRVIAAWRFAARSDGVVAIVALAAVLAHAVGWW
jgi:hypothetical protein